MKPSSPGIRIGSDGAAWTEGDLLAWRETVLDSFVCNGCQLKESHEFIVGLTYEIRQALHFIPELEETQFGER
jgi:hypothetical protein